MSTGDWTTAALGDLVDLRLSSVDKKSEPDETPVLLCNYTDVYRNRLIHSDLDFMRATATEREIEKCALQTGDVVITKDSEQYDDIGVPALIRDDAPDLVCGYHLAILRPRTEIVEGGYLFHALNTREVQHQFHAYANGVTRFGLRKADIERVQIPVPPLGEQRRIAGVLGGLDDKIELNRRMAQTLEQVARALFRSWFVDFEPVRAKQAQRWSPGQSLPGLPAQLHPLFPDQLEPSPQGPIPQGWQVATLGEIATFVRESTEPQSSPDTVFEHYSIPAFDDGKLPVRQVGSEIKSAKLRVPPDAVLVSRLNPEIERVWLPPAAPDDQAVCSTEFLVLTPTPPFTRHYVYCLARSQAFRGLIESLVTGTSKSHQRARADAVLSLDVLVPPRPLVEAFGQQAVDLLDRALHARDEAAHLSSVRDRMLPRLMPHRPG